MIRARRLLASVLALAVAAALAGCAGTVSMQPAGESNDPACADVSVALPGTLDGQARRWTDAQATAAWGDPAAVLFTCGLEPLGPTTLPCQTVNGVDWVIDETDAPKYRVTSYGRVPAVEVYLDNDIVASAEVLDALSIVVSRLPADGSTCVPRESADGS